MKIKLFLIICCWNKWQKSPDALLVWKEEMFVSVVCSFFHGECVAVKCGVSGVFLSWGNMQRLKLEACWNSWRVTQPKAPPLTHWPGPTLDAQTLTLTSVWPPALTADWGREGGAALSRHWPVCLALITHLRGCGGNPLTSLQLCLTLLSFP